MSENIQANDPSQDQQTEKSVNQPVLSETPHEQTVQPRTKREGLLIGLVVFLACLCLYLYWQKSRAMEQRDELFIEYVAMKESLVALQEENDALNDALAQEQQELNLRGWLKQLEDDSSSLIDDLSTVLDGAQRRFFDGLESEIDELKEKLDESYENLDRSQDTSPSPSLPPAIDS